MQRWIQRTFSPRSSRRASSATPTKEADADFRGDAKSPQASPPGPYFRALAKQTGTLRDAHSGTSLAGTGSIAGAINDSIESRRRPRDPSTTTLQAAEKDRRNSSNSSAAMMLSEPFVEWFALTLGTGGHDTEGSDWEVMRAFAMDKLLPLVNERRMSNAALSAAASSKKTSVEGGGGFSWKSLFVGTRRGSSEGGDKPQVLPVDAKVLCRSFANAQFESVLMGRELAPSTTSKQPSMGTPEIHFEPVNWQEASPSTNDAFEDAYERNRLRSFSSEARSSEQRQGIWGCPLDELPQAICNADSALPRVILRLMQVIWHLHANLRIPNLFRLEGQRGRVDEICAEISGGFESAKVHAVLRDALDATPAILFANFDEASQLAHDLAGVVKRYWRSIPGQLLPRAIVHGLHALRNIPGERERRRVARWVLWSQGEGRKIAALNAIVLFGRSLCTICHFPVDEAASIGGGGAPASSLLNLTTPRLAPGQTSGPGACTASSLAAILLPTLADLPPDLAVIGWMQGVLDDFFTCPEQKFHHRPHQFIVAEDADCEDEEEEVRDVITMDGHFVRQALHFIVHANNAVLRVQ